MLVDKIIKFENNYAEIQANVIEKTYGKIFYDKNNPFSYDSNHALINENTDYDSAIKDMVNFYESIAITPRVYTFTKNISAVGQYLETQGFNKSIEEICFFVQKNKIIIDIPKTIDFKRLKQIDETVYELFQSDSDQGEWGYKALIKSIDKEHFYLFGGYVDNNLVCIASIYKQNDISRINDVFTKKDKRGNGYGSQLINFITDFNDKNLKTISYLYANNHDAIKIYKKAGYEEINAIIRGCYWLE
ncbi:GNAT family N-acetyltransferase [Neobacillus sp. PS3-40]|uniref:GNAT family N-acetyltransferase n=1 Tax=Neobacillus sp. PS3-40 TaxID=3070679 RepID=UPI0027E04FB4|nr:GNAT family N-acetyltransferase [Neobacillus sp. PS3-40]WML44322.1 GNAT family N-acetyltransferase [Neobacillus sp. PS3-40]